MKVTGYRLREAIKVHDLRRSTAANQFSDCQFAFDDESKTKPTVIADVLLTSERAIATLQTAQASYNLQIKCKVFNMDGNEEFLTLSEAIKCVGGIARVEKMWRTVASGSKKDRYDYQNDRVRETTKILAKPTVTQEEAMKLALKAAAFAGSMRAAIATSNSIELEIQDLDPQLLSGV